MTGMPTIERALIIREPWIDDILAGRKTWEMRSQRTSVRGWIGLIRQGSGAIEGACRIVDSLPPLDRARYMDHRDRHAIPPEMLDEVIEHGWTHPWVLADVRPFSRKVPYRHRSGAVTFVGLDPSVSAEMARLLAGGAPARPQHDARSGREEAVPAPSASPVPPAPQRAPAAPAPAREPVPGRDEARGHPSDGALVQLSDGNVNNGHFSVRGLQGLIPRGALGGTNSDEPGVPFTIRFGGETFETDIAGDKMIPRKRFGAVYRRLGVRGGDALRVRRTGEREWTVGHVPA